MVLDPRAAEDYARHLAANASVLNESGEPVSRAALCHEDAWEIVKFVKGDLQEGTQDPIAQVVLHRRRWSKALWYTFAETGFADAWQVRSVPLTVGASANTVAALTEVAREGNTRRARVAAAAALITEKPELAEEVLLEEYANFQIDSSDMFTKAPFSCPLGTGRYLEALGVMVPEELTTVSEANEMYVRERYVYNRLKERGGSPREHKNLLAAAANLFNRELRTMLTTGQFDKLHRYLEPEQRSELFRKCWKEAPEELKRRREVMRGTGGLWSSGDDEDNLRKVLPVPPENSIRR
jgi:hypothetical protein